MSQPIPQPEVLNEKVQREHRSPTEHVQGWGRYSHGRKLAMPGPDRMNNGEPPEDFTEIQDAESYLHVEKALKRIRATAGMREVLLHFADTGSVEGFQMRQAVQYNRMMPLELSKAFTAYGITQDSMLMDCVVKRILKVVKSLSSAPESKQHAESENERPSGRAA